MPPFAAPLPTGNRAPRKSGRSHLHQRIRQTLEGRDCDVGRRAEREYLLAGPRNEGGPHPGPCCTRHIPPVGCDEQALGHINPDPASSPSVDMGVRLAEAPTSSTLSNDSKNLASPAFCIWSTTADFEELVKVASRKPASRRRSRAGTTSGWGAGGASAPGTAQRRPRPTRAPGSGRPSAGRRGPDLIEVIVAAGDRGHERVLEQGREPEGGQFRATAQGLPHALLQRREIEQRLVDIEEDHPGPCAMAESLLSPGIITPGARR